MVDLHPTEPGLPAGHPWLSLSRWGMAWRVTFGTLLVGMLGAMGLGAFDVLRAGDSSYFFGWGGVFFGVLPAPIFGLLAALIGPWLRKFAPVTQGVVFGLIGVAVVFLVLLIWSLIVDAGNGCPPGSACAGSGWGFVWVAVVGIAGLPLAIMAGGGLCVAILAAAHRTAFQTTVAILVAVVLAFVAAQAANSVREERAQIAREAEREAAASREEAELRQRQAVEDWRQQHGEAPYDGPCAGFDRAGNQVLVDCLSGELWAVEPR